MKRATRFEMLVAMAFIANGKTEQMTERQKQLCDYVAILGCEEKALRAFNTKRGKLITR